MRKRLLSLALALVMALAVVPTATAESNTMTDPSIGSSYYATVTNDKQKTCVWYALGRYKQLGGKQNLSGLGDAKDWCANAKKKGLTVGSTPKVGAVACWNAKSSGGFTDGHVAVVEWVSPDGSWCRVSQYNRGVASGGANKFGGFDDSYKWTANYLEKIPGKSFPPKPDCYIYLQSDTTSAKTTITFDLVTPSSFTVGTDIALDGSMSATGSKINSVKVEIVNDANGSVVLSASSSGNFSVETYGPLVAKNSKLNSDLDLGKLSVGTYYARYTVGTQDGTTASKETGRFNVNPVSCNGNHTRGGYLGAADTHPHWVYWRCAICGERYTEWGVETKASCEICNPPEPEKPDCSNGHTWGEWDIMREADCELNGRRQRICSVCGEWEDQPIAAVGHNYKLTDVTATEKVYTCSRCGDSYTEKLSSGSSPETGDTNETCQHEWSDWTIYEYCGMEGWKWRTCKKCGEWDDEDLPPMGHDWQLDRDGYYRCARCNMTDYTREPDTQTSGIDNFQRIQYFYSWSFDDVGWNDWYYDNVSAVYELGLMKGTGSGTFSPGNNVTLAEAITLAARIHSIYYTGSDSFASYDGGNWYDPYVDYARENNIINTYYNYSRPATREEFVHILAKALPEEALENIAGRISFADSGDITYMAEVQLLSGAGVINGIKENGQLYFKPLNTITRAEVAAVVARMAKPSQRVGN